MYLVERDTVPSLNLTSGAVLIGIFVNTFFYGVVFYQFVSYYTAKFNDPLWIRIVVMSLLLIDTFQTCELLYVPWYLLIENYNNPQALGAPLWGYGITPALDSVAAAITQIFLVHRIYRLGKRLAICIPILVLIVGYVALGISVSVYGITLKQVSNAYTIPTTIPWLAVNAFTDILISAILCWILWSSRTGNRRTDWALQTLFRKSIQTGIPAALVALGVLFTYSILGTQTNLIFAALTFPHGRIYTLTLMDTLLVRVKLRREMAESETVVLRNVRSTMTPASGPSKDPGGMRLVRISSVSAFKDREQYSAGSTSAGTTAVGTTSAGTTAIGTTSAGTTAVGTTSAGTTAV